MNTKLTIHLKPGSKHDKIERNNDGSLAISVTSRPVENKANEHLIKLLSKALHVSKSSCTIIQGEKSRNKVVVVEGLQHTMIMEMISRRDAK